MKKTAAIIVVLLLLTAQACLAVDLEAGWYANLGLVDIHGWGPSGEVVVSWNFTGALGPQEPFEVTSPDPVWARRSVTVLQTTTGIAPGTAVYLWGEPVTPITFDIIDVVPYWETDYDATRMQLQLLSYSPQTGFTLLWSQTASGHNLSFSGLLSGFQEIPLGAEPVFRVIVVPEPCSFAVLVAACCGILVQRRSRLW